MIRLNAIAFSRLITSEKNPRFVSVKMNGLSERSSIARYRLILKAGMGEGVIESKPMQIITRPECRGEISLDTTADDPTIVISVVVVVPVRSDLCPNALWAAEARGQGKPDLPRFSITSV
jgi:hypothetical protein